MTEAVNITKESLQDLQQEIEISLKSLWELLHLADQKQSSYWTTQPLLFFIRQQLESVDNLLRGDNIPQASLEIAYSSIMGIFETLVISHEYILTLLPDRSAQE